MGLEDLLAMAKNNKPTKDAPRKSLEYPSDTVETIVDKFLYSLNSDKSYNEEGYGGEIERGFHPSALSKTECLRKLYFEYFKDIYPGDTGYTDVNSQTRRIFDNGSYVHSRWQMYFTLLDNPNLILIGDWKCKGCGKTLSPNKEIPYPKFAPKQKMKVSGVLYNTNDDGVLVCPDCGSVRWKYNEFRLRNEELRVTGKRDLAFLLHGEKFLGEIKSINTFQFAKMEAPLPEHLVQFNFYMFLSDVKKGIFIYENKNSQEVKYFDTEYDESIIKGILDKLKKVGKYIDREEIPPKQVFTGNTCKLCPFSKYCE